MDIKLSARLQACANFVPPGTVVTDIGCDHGYLGIYLLKNGIAAYVYAADIRKGPLQCAVDNADKYNVSPKISFHLSDGVKEVPRDFDVMVAAGMGADTMISILENAPFLRCEKYTLILQCQSKTPFLRKYLSETGWQITKETVVEDGRFLYTVMVAQFNPGPLLTAAQCYFSPALRQDDSIHLQRYYRQVLSTLEKIVSAQGEKADPSVIEAFKELQANPIQGG